MESVSKLFCFIQFTFSDEEPLQAEGSGLFGTVYVTLMLLLWTSAALMRVLRGVVKWHRALYPIVSGLARFQVFKFSDFTDYRVHYRMLIFADR